MTQVVNSSSVISNYLVLRIWTLIQIVSAILWMQNFNNQSFAIILLAPSLFSILMIRNLIKNTDFKLNYFDFSIIGYFFVLIISHLFNGLPYSTRLVTWIFIVSSWFFCRIAQNNYSHSKLDIYLTTLLICILSLIIETNDNVLSISLAAFIVLLSSRHSDLATAMLIVLLFIAQFVYENDSSLIVFPLALSIVLVGRARALAIILLICCTIFLYSKRINYNLPLGERDSFLVQSIRAFQESPVVGRASCSTYFTSILPNGKLFYHQHGHNIITTNICETGSLGVFPLLLFLYAILTTWSSMVFHQKFFWSLFGTWSFFDDPFNFIPIVALTGALLNLFTNLKK